MRVSYIVTATMSAATMATMVRRVGETGVNAMTSRMRRAGQSGRSAKVFEPVGQRAAARSVADGQILAARHDANLGYRQFADPATGAPQPAAMAGPARKEQLVILPAAERGGQPVGTSRRVPAPRLIRDRQRAGVDFHADARRARQLAQPVGQAVAEV